MDCFPVGLKSPAELKIRCQGTAMEKLQLAGCAKGKEDEGLEHFCKALIFSLLQTFYFKDFLKISAVFPSLKDSPHSVMPGFNLHSSVALLMQVAHLEKQRQERLWQVQPGME